MDEKNIDSSQSSATPSLTSGQRASDAAHLDQSHAGPIELRHSDGRIEHPSVGHEQVDLNLFSVAVTLVFLGLALMTVGVGTGWLLHGEARLRSERFAAATWSPNVDLPRQPRLEPLEPQIPASASFVAGEQAAEARLHGHAPASETGFVQIPIDKAIDQVAKELRAQGPIKAPAKSQGLVGSGDSNSGRMLREDIP